MTFIQIQMVNIAEAISKPGKAMHKIVIGKAICEGQVMQRRSNLTDKIL